jgi:hypothetical protein
MRHSLFFLLAMPAAAATTIVSINSTPTQAIVGIYTDSPGACTYRVSENSNFIPLLHDVDPNLFAGSDSDARPGSFIHGSDHLFVLGRRDSEKASDGRRYSRALQAGTQHYLGISCGGDAEVRKTFTTENPPLGRTAPEPPPFDPDAFGNYGWPTIDFTDASKTYIDPMTGILLKRVTSSNWRARTLQQQQFAAAIDRSGGNWQNIAALLTWPATNTLGSYSATAGGVLFLATDLTNIPTQEGTNSFTPGIVIDDAMLRLYGNGTGTTASDRTVLACISIDSGQTCATPELPVLLPSSTGMAPTIPAGYPGASWSSWGAAATPITGRDFGTATFNVSTNGTNVTVPDSGNPANYFNRNWSPGVLVRIGRTTYTISAVVNSTTLILNSSAGVQNNVSFKSLAAGFRVRKQTSTGTVSFAAGFDYAYGDEFQTPFLGSYNMCSRNTITVESRTAYLCTVPKASTYSALFVFFPDTGESRELSIFEAGQGQHFPPTDPFDSLNAKIQATWDSNIATRFYTYAFYVSKERGLIRLNYTGDFTSYNPGYYVGGAWPDDHLTYDPVGLPSQGMGIKRQVAALSKNYHPEFWNDFIMQGILDGNKAYWGAANTAYSESPGFSVAQDLDTGVVTAVADSWSQWPARWNQLHSPQPLAGKMMLVVNYPRQNDPGAILGGKFVITPFQLLQNGSWATDTTLSASYAENCSPSIAAQWQALGATGPDCITIRAQEPCSSFPFAGEAALFPCPWDAAKSTLSPTALGDEFWDEQSGEAFRIVNKTLVSGTLYQFELQRRVGCNRQPGGPAQYTHANGWQASMMPVFSCTNGVLWFDGTGNYNSADSYMLSANHSEIGAGPTPGHYTTVAGSPDGVHYGIRYDKSFSAMLNSAPDYFLDSSGRFAGVNYANTSIEQYPSFRQMNAPPGERRWFVDFNHASPSYGSGFEFKAGIGTVTYSLVPGTASVYKFTRIASNQTNVKIVPLIGWAGRYLLRDTSGPSSTVSDMTPWAMCYVYSAGECYAGSNAGEAYTVVPQADLSGSCISGWYTQTAPCVMAPHPLGFFVNQIDASRPQPGDVFWRHLTMAFSGPGRQYEFGNMTLTPDGKWGLVQGYWLDGVRNEILAVKIPPFPQYDDRNRADFVKLTVSVPPGPGGSARIRFGYAENGPESSFFCTTRREACVTDQAATPFAFLQSDALSPLNCTNGCSIDIPGISGRIVYYRVERLDPSGNLIASGMVETAVIP